LSPTARNALRHGLRSGQLPAGCRYVVRITRALRQAIEDAVAARNDGQVSLYHAATINSAIRWERHSLLCQRWLRLEADKLNPDQRLAYSREAAKASGERDKCLRLLGLDRSDLEAQIDQLYRQPWPTPPDAPATSKPAATVEANQPADAPAGQRCDSERDASPVECREARQANNHNSSIQIEGNQNERN
jgi:hypothetical protein